MEQQPIQSCVYHWLEPPHWSCPAADCAAQSVFSVWLAQSSLTWKAAAAAGAAAAGAARLAAGSTHSSVSPPHSSLVGGAAISSLLSATSALSLSSLSSAPM